MGSIAGTMGHIPVLKYMLRNHDNDQIVQISGMYAGTHGEEWQKKFNKAMNIDKRTESARVWKETLEDPAKKKKLEEFNEYYRNLAPHERRVVDRQLLEKTQLDEAKKR